MDRNQELQNLSTFDLAFNIATGKYNESEKFIALDIIKSRESNSNPDRTTRKEKSKKLPLKGSKAEKILQLAKDGKTPKDIGEILKKKHKLNAYPAEIYRVINNYELDPAPVA